MPFNIARAFPEKDPDVQIFFHGLLMLCPSADGKECRVGVHRLSVNHKLSISVRERTSEAHDPPLLRLSGPLDSAELIISVIPETQNGVSQFVPNDNPFDPSAPDNHLMDFRWAIDLETLDPAQEPMKLKNEGIDPSIRIRDGIFHTARLTDPEILEVLLTEVKPTGPATLVKNFGRVARLIGANIYLDDGQTLRLVWFGEGKKQTLDLPGSKGKRPWVINIDNSPALMPVGPGAEQHSEFVEYFKVITNARKTFDLDFNKIAPGPVSHGTDEAPCMAVVVGGGGPH